MPKSSGIVGQVSHHSCTLVFVELGRRLQNRPFLQKGPSRFGENLNFNEMSRIRVAASLLCTSQVAVPERSIMERIFLAEYYC